MAWTLLALAGLFEIGWAIGLKYTEGFTRLVPSVLTGISMVISVAGSKIPTRLLKKVSSMRRTPLSGWRRQRARWASASSRCRTDAYFRCMSNRFTLCESVLRSNTASSTTAVLRPRE